MSFSIAQSEQVAVQPEIKSNLDVNLESVIKKYAGVPHGLSLIAVSMLDPSHKSINVELKYTDQHLLNNAVEYLVAIWHNYEPIPTRIRTYKVNGSFIEKSGTMQFQQNDDVPYSTDAFGHIKVLVDIACIKDGTEYTIKLYRWGEPSPRVLKLYLSE